MRKFFEFQFYEDEWERRAIRFYPKTTHVHGFGDEPPKTWDEVYKTYLSFSALHFDKESGKAVVAYNARWDENSGLSTVADIIGSPISPINDLVKIPVFGDATQWVIMPVGNSYTLFILYPLRSGKSYTFLLDENGVFEFNEMVNEYLEYSLAHSEGI